MCEAKRKTITHGTSVKGKAFRNEDKNDVPLNTIAWCWCRLYRAVPTIYFPGTALNISFTLCSAAVLWVCRIIIYQILVRGFNWPTDGPAEQALSSLTAILHSATLVSGLFVALTTQPFNPTEHITFAPKWWQDLTDALMEFCTGYMLYDSLASYVVGKGLGNLMGSDFLLLGHHIATSLYMTQTRVLKAGHISAMICMLLGEITNPFQSTYTVADLAMKYDCCNGSKMQFLHSFTAMGFAYSYFAVRSIIAPLFFVYMTGDMFFFAKTRRNVPFSIRCVWIFMIWAVEIGSFDWIMLCWKMIQLHLNGLSPTENVPSPGEL